MLLDDILELNTLRAPDRPALIFADRCLSFADLHDRSLRLATALADLAAPGARIAILAENCPEYIDAYYGVPRAGMALVFLNYRLHPRELAWIINDSGATVLIVDRDYLQPLLDVRAEIPLVEHLVVIGATPGRVAGAVDYDDLIAAARPEPPNPRPGEDDIAWQIYTSGTTGRPKGAMLSHRNLFMAVLNSIASYDPLPDDRYLMPFPVCHVAGYSIPMNHLMGAVVVLMKAYEAEAFMQAIERHAITTTALAPTMFTFLLQHPRIDDYDLSSLRSIAYGAAAMPVAVLKEALDRFGPVVYSGFGMTELAGNVLVHPKAAHSRAIGGDEHLLAACGVPMPLAVVRVADDDMNELPPGEVGEIVVRGEQVLTGYWNLPEATEEAFRGGWFHTGDMAKRDEEGYFYIVDRKKDMIITGGENVYSREVEEVLYAVPGVSEAAVIGLPDTTWGERVTAVLTRREGATIDEQQVIRACRERLAGFKTPKQVVFVDEIPKNVSGKVLKRELRERLARPQ